MATNRNPGRSTAFGVVMRALVAFCIAGASCLGWAQTARIYGFNVSNKHLISFNANAPGTLLTDVAVTGLGASDTLIGIDFRPATGELYAVATSNFALARTYRIDTSTGAATQVGAGSVAIGGSFFGMAFNPVPDRLRLVSDTELNIRINPNDGSLSGTDSNLFFAPGDPNANQNPSVSHLAYTNQVPGATSATVFGIDAGTNSLVRIGGPEGFPSPNLGVVTTIGTLGVDPSLYGGLDIQAGTSTAYASLQVGGVSGLYTINLGTGAAALIGAIGPAGTLIDGIAIAPSYGCLDVDGDGRVDALTDGLMLLRAQFGLTGTSITNGALPTPAPPRNTWLAIRQFLNANCGTNFAP